MKPIPLTPATDALACRLVRFEEPAESLADPVRFLAEDIRFLRRYVSDDDFHEALNAAPPGIIRPRSWTYWRARFGQIPALPLPRRRLG
jgi:hypothetical protein